MGMDGAPVPFFPFLAEQRFRSFKFVKGKSKTGFWYFCPLCGFFLTKLIAVPLIRLIRPIAAETIPKIANGGSMMEKGWVQSDGLCVKKRGLHKLCCKFFAVRMPFKGLSEICLLGH